MPFFILKITEPTLRYQPNKKALACIGNQTCSYSKTVKKNCAGAQFFRFYLLWLGARLASDAQNVLPFQFLMLIYSLKIPSLQIPLLPVSLFHRKFAGFDNSVAETSTLFPFDHLFQPVVDSKVSVVIS